MLKSEERWVDVQRYKILCERRWATRADALYTFRAGFEVVVQPLEIFSQDEGATDLCLSGLILLLLYCNNIKLFDLFATEHIFSNTLALSTMLQRKIVDLLEAAQEAIARVVINIMKTERGDPSVWKEVYEWGKQNDFR